MTVADINILKYSTIGNGPEKIIAVHNFWDNQEQYKPICPYLDKDVFTYAFADLRGYGQSRNIKGEYTAKEAAGDIITLADHLGWNTFHLIGHSMSGMVVQRTVVDAKERIKSIIALTPVPATGLQLNEQITKWLINVVTDRKATLDYFTMSIPMFSKRYAEYRANRSWESSTPDIKIAYMKMWNNTDFSKDSKGINTPILVILAEYDSEFNQGVRPFWEKWYPNVEIVMCKNATHHLTDDTPVFVASTIENFLFKQIEINQIK